MKNNLIAKFIFFLIFCINISNSSSEELKFEATSIEIIDKDKIIIANEGVKILSDDETGDHTMHGHDAYGVLREEIFERD